MISPLAIVQARIGSKRLPRKMLLDLGGHPVVWWAWNAARVAFGGAHTVVAIPGNTANDELADVVQAFGGEVFRWDGPEDDVLGRFYHCAHHYRWHPASVIVRVTPDDPWKMPSAMQLVAQGVRMPVEVGGEAFTLGMLTKAHEQSWKQREHLSHIFFSTPAPAPGEGRWTIDTQDDLEHARAMLTKAEDKVFGTIDIADVAGALA